VERLLNDQGESVHTAKNLIKNSMIKCKQCNRDIAPTFAWNWADDGPLCFLCWNNVSTKWNANTRMQEFLDSINKQKQNTQNETTKSNSV